MKTTNAISSVLVIDDHPPVLEALSDLLRALGVTTVCQTHSAERALDILKTQSFSVIAVDYRLEGIDGVEFLEQFRAQGNLTPVLVISGAPDKLGVIRAASQAKADFIGKPFRTAELMGAMEKLVAA